jgi:hypothetical protein
MTAKCARVERTPAVGQVRKLSEVIGNILSRALVPGAIALLAYAGWTFGARIALGRAVIGLVFPLLFIEARFRRGARWRQSLSVTLSLSVLVCTFLLLNELRYLGTVNVSLAPTEKLCVVLEAIAELLCQNAITTSLGLLALLFAYRPSSPPTERNAFRTSATAILLALLSVTTFCAFVLYAVTSM